MERVRVVDLEVGVVDAGVDGLVSKRLLGIKNDVIYSTIKDVAGIAKYSSNLI